MPKRFLRTITRDGLAAGDLRFDECGNKRLGKTQCVVLGWEYVRLSVRVSREYSLKNGLTLPVVTPEFRDHLVDQAGREPGIGY